MILKNINTVKIVCISLTGSSQTRGCEIRVYTKDKIDNMYGKAIRQAWGESMFCRKRRMVVKNNEIMIYLKKGDTVQKYIDSISCIVHKIKYYENSSKNLLLKHHIKHAVLKRMQPSRYYILEHMSFMKMEI